MADTIVTGTPTTGALAIPVPNLLDLIPSPSVASPQPSGGSSNPLGTLTDIFKGVSDAYFGFQQRTAALEYLQKTTQKDATAYSPADKSTAAGSLASSWMGVALGVGVLIVGGVLVAKMLK